MNFKTAAAYILLIVALLCGTLIWYGSTIIHRVTNIENLWIHYNHESTKSSYALNRISSNFGYGGFIHNFKNFILHQDETLIPEINQNLSDTYDAIADYNSLKITEEEKQALKHLSHIVDIYSSKFTFAQRLVIEGKTPREIEVNVQVNDSPAYTALEFLAKYAIERSTQKEAETNLALRDTLFILKWGVLSIPLLIFVGLIIVIFLKRLLKANIEIESINKYSEQLIESSPDAWLIIDETGKIVRINTQAENLFGYTREEFFNQPIELLIPDRFKEGHNKLRDGYFRHPRFRPVKNTRGELHAINKNGFEFPVEISLSYTNRDNKTQAVAAVRDITKRRELESRQQLTEKVFENAAEGILILDQRLRILDTNNALFHLMGYSRKELLGHTPRVLSFKNSRALLLNEIKTALKKNGQWHGDTRLKHKNGGSLPVLTSISEVKSQTDGSLHFVVIFSDISRQKQQEERLEQLAHYDSLTTLPNRVLFFDRFQGALARARRLNKQVGIFYIDLDGFKAVNDTLGHQAGDDVLIKAAKVLLDSIREDDTAARLGGDEFVVLFNDLSDLNTIHLLADRLITNLTFSLPADKTNLPITASIGIAVYPRDGNEEETLLRHADNTMYKAKKMGKNNYAIYSSGNY